MVSATTGKRARPVAAKASRVSRNLPSPPPPPTAGAQYTGEAVEDDDEEVDWAAEFEDVEQAQPEHKQQQQQPAPVRDDKGKRKGAKDRKKHKSGVSHLPASNGHLQPQAADSEIDTSPPLPLHHHFDYHFSIPLPTTSLASASLRSLHSTLVQALSDRVTSLHVHSRPPKHVVLSLAVSQPASTAFRVVDLGPEASSPAAAKWRADWCERSELRRFQDGRVLECVVWRAESEAELEEERRMGEASVLLRILRWTLKRKAQLSDTSGVRFVGWQAHQLLKRREVQSHQPLQLSASPTVATTPADTAALQTSFSALSALLKSLSLPLSFTSITAVHPFFRYTDPFPPLPLSADALRSSSALPVVDVVAQFESSSAWPGSLYAIQQIKTAFLIELASALRAAASPLLASPPTVSHTHVDVLTAAPATYCFRLHLAHHAELPPLSLHLHQAVRAFALRRGEAGVWAGLVCLAKRWAQCHMWGDMLGDCAVELLCAAWWMQSGRGREEADESDAAEGIRAGGTGGVSNALMLLIGWLEWLGAHDFAAGPLVVSLPATSAPSPTSASASLSDSASSFLDRAQAAYTARRAAATASDPLPALYIATPADLTSSVTSPHLTAQLLSRLQLTAARCASHLAGLIDRCELGGWMSAFKPDTSSFDILLHLSAEEVSGETLRCSIGRVRGAHTDERKEESGEMEERRAGQAKRVRGNAYKPPIDERKDEPSRAHELLWGVDVQREYVRALQHQLGAYADVHADLYGGTVVGLRLKRRPAGGGRWKVSESGYSRWRGGADARVEWNVDEMLADAQLIGQGILERVELQVTSSA